MKRFATFEPSAIRRRYDAALAGLAANCKNIRGYDRPVLFEGGAYQGIWLECAPHESLVYAKRAPEVAVATHEAFFHFQREDGYLPFNIGSKGPGSITIQMVVPIASTALDLAKIVGDEAFLQRAYEACSRWDNWLVANRNTRGTGLCELFCQFDSGHDGSPRHAGFAWQCPDNDPENARIRRACPIWRRIFRRRCMVAALPWLRWPNCLAKPARRTCGATRPERSGGALSGIATIPRISASTTWIPKAILCVFAATS